MSIRASWIIGLLLAVIIGLAAGLAIVAGDSSDDEPEAVSFPTETETEATEIQAGPTVIETTTDQGGVSPPTPPRPDGTGGLGAE
jgi:hypothetical protein